MEAHGSRAPTRRAMTSTSTGDMTASRTRSLHASAGTAREGPATPLAAVIALVEVDATIAADSKTSAALHHVGGQRTRRARLTPLDAAWHRQPRHEQPNRPRRQTAQQLGGARGTANLITASHEIEKTRCAPSPSTPMEFGSTDGFPIGRAERSEEIVARHAETCVMDLVSLGAEP